MRHPKAQMRDSKPLAGRDWKFIAKQPVSAPHMLRIVPQIVRLVGCSYEQFLDGFELHLLRQGEEEEDCKQHRLCLKHRPSFIWRGRYCETLKSVPYLSIYLSIDRSIYLFIFLSIYPSTFLFIHIYPSMHLSMYVSIYLSISLSLYIYTRLYTYIYTYIHTYICIYIDR